MVLWNASELTRIDMYEPNLHFALYFSNQNSMTFAIPVHSLLVPNHVLIYYLEIRMVQASLLQAFLRQSLATGRGTPRSQLMHPI